MENAVRIIGTVGQILPELKMVQVLTKAVSKGVEYVTSHAVKVDEIDEKLIKEGQKIDVFGSLDQHGKRTIVKATTVKKVAKNASFVNIAKLHGETARAFEYFPPKPGKRAFGNLLVRMGEMFARGVVFNHKAREFDGTCPVGSEVEIVGRLNYRENKAIDPETGEQKILKFAEVIGDPDQTRLIKAAAPVDHFAGTPAEAQPAPAEESVDNGIPF